MRAALVNLLAWITDGTEPPPNAVPNQADGTAVDRRTVLDEMAAIPGLARPEAERLGTVRPLDLGPGESMGSADDRSVDTTRCEALSLPPRYLSRRQAGQSTRRRGACGMRERFVCMRGETPSWSP